MSSEYFRLPRRCGVGNCRSREYIVDADGLTYCRRGHVQESRGLAHSQDFEDVNVAASQTTRIRDSQRQESERAAIRALSGPVGLKLYRLAYEHVLRRQLQILIHQKGFLPELEQLGMELWALRVVVARENGVDFDSEQRATAIKVDDNGQDRGSPAIPKDRAAASDSNLGESEASDSDDNLNRRGKRRGRAPGLLEMYAICYLAAAITRNPLTVRQLHEWVVSDELLYLRAISTVPEDMRRRFEPWFYVALGVLTPLGQETLQWQIASLTALLLNRFVSLRLPNLNWHPILLDYCFRLAVPLHVYSFLEGLFRVLDVELSFPYNSNEDGEEKRDGLDNTTAIRRQSNGQIQKNTAATIIYRLPGIQLMAWLVFAVKFLYPFDGRERFATSSSDLEFLAVDWNEWLEAHERHGMSVTEGKSADSAIDTMQVMPRPFGPGAEMLVDPHEARNFDQDQMDTYMDWFTDTWIDGGVEDVERRDEVGAAVTKTGDGPRAGTGTARSSKSKYNVSVPEGILRMFPLTESSKQRQRTGDHTDTGPASTAQSSSEQQRREMEIAAQQRLIRDVHAHLHPRTLIADFQREKEQDGTMRGLDDEGTIDENIAGSTKRRDKHKKEKQKREKKPLLVGQRYTRYRTASDLDAHGLAARRFHERAALAAQVELPTLLKAVLIVEAEVVESKEKVAQYKTAASEELAALEIMIEEGETANENENEDEYESRRSAGFEGEVTRERDRDEDEDEAEPVSEQRRSRRSHRAEKGDIIDSDIDQEVGQDTSRQIDHDEPQSAAHETAASRGSQDGEETDAESRLESSSQMSIDSE